MLSPQIQTQESPGQVSLLRETQDAVGPFKKKGAARPGGFAALIQGLLTAGKMKGGEDTPERAQAALGKKPIVDSLGAGRPDNLERKAVAEDSRSKRGAEKGSAELKVRTAESAGAPGRAVQGGQAQPILGGEVAVLSAFKTAGIPQQTETVSPGAKVKNALAEEAAPAQKGESKIFYRRTGPESVNLEISSPEAGLQVLFQGAARGAGLKAETQRGDGEESPENRIEGKKRDKRKDRLELEVHDLRTRGAEQLAKGLEAPLQEPVGAINETELVVELNSGNGERRAGGSTDEIGKSSSFQDALARELRNGANADIVRHASLVLKDGGEGLIRLNLKPESLGTVKIRLEMADNKIAGIIVVESEDALRAFEKEIRSLEQAFVDGGFDGASLELSVAADGAGDRKNREDGGGPKPFYSERLAAADYNAAAADITATESYRYGGAEAAVDMLA